MHRSNGRLVRVDLRFIVSRACVTDSKNDAVTAFLRASVQNDSRGIQNLPKYA